MKLEADAAAAQAGDVVAQVRVPRPRAHAAVHDQLRRLVEGDALRLVADEPAGEEGGDDGRVPRLAGAAGGEAGTRGRRRGGY